MVFDPTYARKRVLALGRLSLYGSGAARLHEEIIATAAFWVEGTDKDRLEPFATPEAEEKALASLGAVLSRKDQQAIPEHIVSMLMKSAAADESALWLKLQTKAVCQSVFAQERLRGRGKIESDEMERILKSQLTAIDKELNRRKKVEREAQEMKQVVMPWLPEEAEQKKQYDADSKYIERRLGDLEKELSTEPGRIRDQYDVKHYRLERIGLVYLWPTTS